MLKTWNICPSAICFLLQKYFLKHFARDNFIKHKFLIFEKSVPNWCSGGEIKVTHMVYRYMRLWLGKIENSWICTEEKAKYVQQRNERYDILDIITPFWKWDKIQFTFLDKWLTVTARASNPLALCPRRARSLSFSRFFSSRICSSLANSAFEVTTLGDWLTLTKSGWWWFRK